MNTTVTHAMLLACAEAAHEVNRIYCFHHMSDHSQVPWGYAPQWQRDSAINGVRGVLEDHNSPEQSHESWLKEKQATGWTYGPTKDVVKKEHPCMVPYAELSPEQRKKDFLFVNTVKNMAVVMGWRDAQVAQLQGRGE